MPIYKALILNKEINVNYEQDQKDKLEEAIEAVNLQLKNFDNLNGKISDNKLLSFLVIKLQAEVLDLNKKNKKDLSLEKKVKESDNDNISLNDKLYKLREQNNNLEKEKKLINKDLKLLENQINIIIGLLKDL